MHTEKQRVLAEATKYAVMKEAEANMKKLTPGTYLAFLLLAFF